MSLQKIKDLSPLHAASGLVKRADIVYVIADDDLSLASFSLKEVSKIHFLPLISGTLPEDHLERKKVKPDWESLVWIPSHLGFEGLLAVPSGSKPNRQSGSLIKFQNDRPVSSQVIDFSGLYKNLEKEFKELNIEGAAFLGSSLKLLQRGNGPSGQNAIIDIDAQGFVADLLNSGVISEKIIPQIKKVDLGFIDGVRASFTDACACGDQLFFLAVAEESPSTYDDGKYLGSFLGSVDPAGNPSLLFKLDCPTKPEGLWVENHQDQYQFYIVTDADNPSLVSSLFYGSFAIESKTSAIKRL